MKRILFLFLLAFLASPAGAQFTGGFNRFGSFGGGSSNRGDSLGKPRKHEVDTVSVRYRILNEVRTHNLDSSYDDFTRYLPLKADEAFTGALGSPSHHLVFQPSLRPGFDHGFHAFDSYLFRLEDTRFYQSTRPYTELGYLVGSRQEQMINILHTQTRSDQFNFGFQYRKINAPGYFKNQSTNHDNYNVFAHYNTLNRRYHIDVSYVFNKLNAGENGGIRNDSLLNNPDYKDRLTIPVNLGLDQGQNSRFFANPINNRNSYALGGLLWMHHYDWGKADTLHINDTTVRYVFYPVFRVQHTFEYRKESFEFSDSAPDTGYYPQHYNIVPNGTLGIYARHEWTTVFNDLSLIQFPVNTNQAHFIKAGARWEYIRGQFLYSSTRFYNLMGHFEYRNRTRNDRWDLEALGELYLLGNNFGDYRAQAQLSRFLSKKLGDVQVAFTNVNRTPDYVYRFFEYNVNVAYQSALKKENTTLLAFRADNPLLKYQLTLNYYLFNNFTYWKNYYQSDQYSTAFSLLQLILSKQFSVGPISWYIDLAYQQTDGASPLSVPNFWTRNRIAYENKALFRNLHLSTGVELRYHSNYYAYDYSPLLGQFVVQRNQKISYRSPDVVIYTHFRIKSFTAFVRAENLNTFFYTNNFAAPHYPYPNFVFRVGLKWGFIN